MEETIQHEKRDSIEISRNAKGDIAWKAKLYFDNDEQGFVNTVDELASIHTLLKEKFL